LIQYYLILLLEYFLELVSSKETSTQHFESILSSLHAKDSNYKTVTLAYAFWLYNTSPEPMNSQDIYTYFKLLDTSLIVCGPDSNVVEVIDKSHILIGKCSIITFSEHDSFNEQTLISELPILSNELKVIDDPSIGYFQKCMGYPVSINGLISNWPALARWNRPSFWVEIAGHRFFPVEIGCHYLDTDWRQEIIQLNDFFQKYVFDIDNKEIAYIAQHNWIHQIPHLALDFETPEICDIFLNPDMGIVLTHMWFGGKRTFTPLHFDKYNNILSQIVGQKYVLLIDPKFSEILSRDHDNTSKIIDENISDYLLQQGIPFQEVILKAGQSLYIPSFWWHQVKSLSFSVSMSFWF
jgi:hypothetical protein